MTDKYKGPDILWVEEEAYSDTNIEQAKYKLIKTKKRAGYLALSMLVLFIGLIFIRDEILHIPYKSNAFNMFAVLSVVSLFSSMPIFLYYLMCSMCIDYIVPIVGKPECAELMYWAERDDEIAKRVERIKNQGRKAYLFDHANAKCYLENKQFSFSNEEIDAACKKLHGV